MAQYISGRQKNLKVGLTSYSEGTTSLQVTGNVGIATTNATSALWVAGDGYFTGVVTASSLSGNAKSATYATSAGIATYATSAGIATYATNAGIATYATNAGTSTSVIGGIGSITQLQVSGISTFTNGPVFIGAATSTGTASQPLQVTGNAYVSTALGIGRTNPGVYSLDVNGVARIGGAAYGKVSFGTGQAVGEFGLSILPYSDRTELQAEQQGTAYRPLSLNPLGGGVGIGTTNPSAVLDVRGTPWFSPNITGVKATALRLGRFIDGVNAAYDIITDDNIGDDIEIQSNRYTGNVRISRGSPSGIQTTFILASHYQLGSSISIADTTGTTTKIKIDEAGNTFFNNTGAVLVGAISSTGTASQPLQVTGGAYFSGSVGVGTTNPQSALDVRGNVLVSGISTLGVTSVTNLTAQILNVSGVSTLGNVTVGSGNTTLIVSGTTRVSGASTFDGNVTLSTGALTVNTGGMTVGGAVVFNNGSTNITAASQTTGTLTLGGPAQTGTIVVGQSTSTSLIGIATGASGVGTTKTINFGTGGLSGSFTQINIGPGPSAGVGTVVINSGTNLGIGSTTPTSRLDVVGDAKVSGVVTATTFIGALTGTATTATALQNARNFSITGNFVTATAISFDGTGNVALAATIPLDAIGLGTYTTGDYVKNISGTSNQITVTGGTGEGSTPTLSIPSQFTAPQDVTVTRDLQVNRNLNVTGNITIGGTTAFINVQQLQVYDQDLVLGFRTDGSGNDVSNDTTANHGGIAVASTEGSPLVSLYNPGIGESTVATYKKIMWFKSGSFAGLGTDAWLINYAVGIGSTQFPTGTRLAAGSVQFTQNDLAVVRNINASGVITATSGFSGNASSATYATSAGIATYATNAGTSTSVIGGIGSITQLQVSGISTFSGIVTHTTSLFGTTASFTGIVTASSFSGNASSATYATSAGIATYATNAGTSTSVIGGIGSITQLQVSGISTLGIVQISSGIITATSGVVTYYGDGSKLSGVNASGSGAGGTSGQIQYNNSGIITGANYFNYDNTQYRVGIGTSVPTARLSVASTSSGNSLLIVNDNLSDGTLFRVNDNNANVLMDVDANGTILFLNSGNVGIGSTLTSPTSKLQVTGDVLVSGVLTASSFSGNVTSATYATNAGTSTSVIGGIGSITQLQVSGISTLGTVKISSGIITATSGVVTYYGYGGNLTGIITTVSGAGSAGQIQYNNNGPVGGANYFNYDNTQYRVGIGTSVPTARLSVASTSTGNSLLIVNDNLSDGTLFRVNDNSSNVLMDVDANGTILFLNSGNVGIGSTLTSPTSKLQVAGDALISGVITATTHIGNLTGTAVTVTTGIITNITSTNVNASGNVNVSGITTTQILNVGTGGTIIATTSAGNVGVGTAVPTSRFNVAAPSSGNSLMVVNDNLSDGTLFRVNDNSANVLMDVDANGTTLFPSSAGTLSIGTYIAPTTLKLNVVGSAYISTSVGIGTTNPTQSLHVQGSARITGAVYDSNNNVGTAGSILSSTGSGLSWVSSAPAGAVTGLVVRDSNNNIVGTSGSITQLTFASGFGVTAITGAAGIATITLSSNLVGTALSVSGISTLGITSATNLTSQTLNVSGVSTFAGITTHTASLFGTTASFTGIVTANSFRGDGSQLTGLVPNTVSTSTTSIPQYIGFLTTNSGTTSSILASSILTYIPSTGSLGIGTTNPFGSIIYNGLDVNRSNVKLFARNIGTGSDAAVWAADQDYFSTPSYKGTGIIKFGTGTAGNIFGSIAYADAGVLSFQNTAIGLIYTNGQSPLIFGTFSAERARFDGLSGNLGIGTANPSQTLHVQGNARVTGGLYDSNNNVGTAGSVLSSTGSGLSWIPAPSGGGGAGTTFFGAKFDTNIDSTLYIQPTGELAIVGVGTTTTQITTLPGGSNKYLVHSIHVTNISNGDAEISAGFLLNSKAVPSGISTLGNGGAGINTITVGSASSITVGMAVTGTGNIGETVGIGSTAGFQFNTYVTSVDGNIISFNKNMSGIASGTAYFTPVSKVASRLPVPVGSAVELLKQPMVLNALDSIVLQSTGAGSGVGSTSTAAISQTANSNILTVTAGAAITNFIAAGQLITPTGSNTGIQTNTFVGIGYTPGSLSVPMTRPATVSLASTSLSFTEVIAPEDGALQATIVYQTTTDTSFQNGTGTVSAASSTTTSVTAGLSTVPSVYYGTGNTYPSTIQSIKVSNISDGSIYPGGDYPVSVGIGNSDTIFSWLAYNMVIPRNSSIELCEAPKRLGIGQSIFAVANTPYTIEIQIAGRQKTS